MQPEARPAVPADLAALVDLFTAGVDEQRPARGGDLWSRRHVRLAARAELAEAIEDDDQAVLCGTIDGVVVGYGTARVEVLADGGRLGIVDDILVDPEARGVGVGEVIMDELLVFCRQQGCLGVDSLALPGNRETKNFFERFGFTARALIVHKPLEQ